MRNFQFCFVLIACSSILVAEIEQGTVEVEQLDGGVTSSSLSLSLTKPTSAGVTLKSNSDRGDYGLGFSPADDTASGVLIATVAENGRSNEEVGGPAGTKYPTVCVSQGGTEWWIRSFQPAENTSLEFNVDTSFAYFPYDEWLGGFANNSVNSGTITSLTGSPGVSLSLLTPAANETYRLDLRSVPGFSDPGILLINHAKHENNYGLSRALGGGVFTVYVHDNGEQGQDYELDPFCFVYLPRDHGSDQVVAMGRVNGDASTDVEAGTFTLSAGDSGRWYLSIPGHSPETGTLLLSPEGNDNFNVDNIVSHEWDPVLARWEIQSRDLPGTGLQGMARADEDAFSFAFITTPASTIHVDAGATGTGDGRSWLNAFTDLQAALAIANPGDKILVAEGTYTPGTNRGDAFILPDAVEIHGGFPGGGGPFARRDFRLHRTILSGDIDGDDASGGGNAGNSHRIVIASTVSGATVLDGLTISGGNANGSAPENNGAALWCRDGVGPTVRNCVFENNVCDGIGGAVYCRDGVAPSFTNCLFVGNRANQGGAIFSTNASAPLLVNCTLQGNQSNLDGGAISNLFSSTTTLVNCLVWNNQANGATTGVTASVHDAVATTSYSHSLVQNIDLSAVGTNNFDGTDPTLDPHFVAELDPAAAPSGGGDHRLQGGSAAIGVGDNAANALATDVDGEARIVRATIDLGAHEMVDPPWCVDLAATTGGNDGQSWGNAFTDLQSALAVAADGEEIWVAEGSYQPTSGTAENIYFNVTREISLLGGFPAGGSLMEGRDSSAHSTELSGEINTAAPGDNSLHVVVIAPGLATCLVDGLTITGGYADGAGNGGRGGGIFVENDAAPVFRDVIVTGNHCVNDGGGVMVETGGTAVPIFENVTFSGNTAADSGGAVYNWNRSPQYLGCTFIDNSAVTSGGAMFSNTSTAMVIDCLFRNNTAVGGGGMYNATSSLTVTGCTFQENHATGSGSGGAIFNNTNSDAVITACRFLGNTAPVTAGALRNRDDSDVTIINSVFVGNTANSTSLKQGGAIWNGSFGACTLTIINSSFFHNEATSGGAIHAIDTPPVIQNSILWGNSPDQTAGTVALSGASANNLIEGVGGALDPLVVRLPDPGDGDWSTAEDNDYGDLRLTENSPAIGQGDNGLIPAGVTTDLAGEPRVEPFEVDLGAYESRKLSVVLADVPTFPSHGVEQSVQNWAPDGTAYNNGSGFTYQFTLLSASPGMTFDVLPVVDADGTLRFTPTDLAGGSATFGVTVTDPGGFYLPPAPQTITLTTGEIHRVDAGVVGGNNDGSTWADAFQDLGTALAAASFGDELWVAQGTYETASAFSIDAGVAILGGFFPGGGDGTFSQRVADPAATILSGGAVPGTSGNADHVVVIEPDLSRVVLDRLTLANGFADGAGDDAKGAAVFVGSNSTPFLTDVVVANNRASGDGGAIHFESGGLGNPIFERVSFHHNQSGSSGGAVHLPVPTGNRRPEFRDCEFIGNTASLEGGALNGSPGSVTGCLFQANYALESGGAIYHREGTMEVLASSFGGNSTDGLGEIITSGGAICGSAGTGMNLTLCLFDGNSSGRWGGAVASFGTADIVNCGFFNNQVDMQGGGFYGVAGRIEHSTFSNNVGAGIYLRETTLLRHSILWDGDGGAPILLWPLGGALAEDSGWNIVENGLADGIDGTVSESDPLFVDPVAGDFRVLAGSPAINGGNKRLLPTGLATDLNGDPRLVPFQLDIGAYEFQGSVLPAQAELDVTYATRLEAGLHAVDCWVTPGHGLDFDLQVVASSGNLVFDVPPMVLPDGTLQFSLAEQSYGEAVIDAVATGPDMAPLTFRFTITSPFEMEFPKVAVSFGYVATQSLSSSPLLKVARIRGYLHPPGTRKGIAIMPDGFSTTLGEFGSPESEIGNLPLGSPDGGIRKRAFEEGFDVYTIHWHDPRAHVEDHAVIIADFLKGLAGGGFPGAGHASGYNDMVGPGEKVVVIGESMGGLISRTALCYLDRNAIPYQCDLFLSVDSPQEGAYIPIGLQHLGQYLASIPTDYIDQEDIAAITAENSALDQPAPRQMLLVHQAGVGAPHAPERDDFLALLASLGDWPSNPRMRMAAIASGRGDGLFEDNSEEYKDPERRVLLNWKSDKVSIPAGSISIPGVCINDTIRGVDSSSFAIKGQVFTTAWGLDPATPGSAGSSVVFVGDAKLVVDIEAETTNGVDRSGSFEVDLSGTPESVIQRMRFDILDIVAPTGIRGPCQDEVYGQIDAGIEAEIGKIMALAPLRRTSNTRIAGGSWHWDFLPGGIRNTAKTAAEAMDKGGKVISVSNNHCFIPTTSALGLSTAIAPQGVAIPENAAELSPFDALYHFGTHTNTTHLRNSAGIDFWLSDIVSHELGLLFGDFGVDLDQVPVAVGWQGPGDFEEFDVDLESWTLRSSERSGMILLPDPAPPVGLFRLRFDQVYENDPEP